MRTFLILAILSISAPTWAMSFIKCNTNKGKTLWASFGRMVKSGVQEYTYFPTEFVVFSSRDQLQERILYDKLTDALAIPVRVTAGSIGFEFASKDSAGNKQRERIALTRISREDPNSFAGSWVTIDGDGQHFQENYCSVY